jgi:hypothetical protein
MNVAVDLATYAVMARLDQAIQPPRVCAANEFFIAWMARFCGP